MTGRGSTCRHAALLVVGGLIALGLAPAVQAASTDLVLSEASRSADGTARVVATVPAALSDRDLQGAFVASQGGRDVALTVARVLPASELVLALDTTGGAEQLTAEQSAAVDLLRGLPADTPTTVLPTGARSSAVDALPAVAALTPSSARLLDGLPAPAAGRRVVVALTGCPAVSGETRTVTGEAQVSVLALGAGCGTGASRLAGTAPGVVRTGLDTGRLFAAVDETARALRGQYVLASAQPVGGGQLTVTVRADSTTATAGTQLSGAGDPLAEGGRDEDAPAWSLLLAGGLALVAAAGLGAELLARRRTAPAS